MSESSAANVFKVETIPCLSRTPVKNSADHSASFTRNLCTFSFDTSLSFAAEHSGEENNKRTGQMNSDFRFLAREIHPGSSTRSIRSERNTEGHGDVITDRMTSEQR